MTRLRFVLGPVACAAICASAFAPLPVSQNGPAEAIWNSVLNSYARRARDTGSSYRPAPAHTQLVLQVRRPPQIEFRRAWLDSLIRSGVIDRLCSAGDRAKCAAASGTIVLVLRDPTLLKSDSAALTVDEGAVSPGQACANDWTEVDWSVRLEGGRWVVLGRRYGANSLEECAR